MQRRAPLSSTLGAESTRTPSPHFSAGRRVHGDARPPHPPFQRRAPSGRRIHKTPNPAISARGASPAQMGGDLAPPLKRRPESSRTPTPPHFSVGRFPGPDQQGPPPFHFSAGLPRVSGSTRRPPFQLGELPAQVRRDVPGCGPSHQVCEDAERRRPCAWSRVALGIRGFTGHLSLRRSDVKGACLTAWGLGCLLSAAGASPRELYSVSCPWAC